MSYNSNLPEDITLSRADIRENLRALKEDKIVDAATAVVADSAAKLTTARKISLEGDATGSTSFDGSADVAIQVDVLSADKSATATKLETARTINGVEFDGTKDITIKAEADGGNADTVEGKTVNDIISACSIYAVPAGAVEYFAMANAPTGWLKADGSAVPRTQYANLFTAIGTIFGTGDGSNTFNLPDLRGEFVRGFDNGRGVDSGRVLGSMQSSQNLSHVHSILFANGSGTKVGIINESLPNRYGATAPYYAGTRDGNTYLTYEGGTEARPRNVALLACIKY